eukprot:COSAG01_NODE_7426_length_3213_cov_20.062620_1_plen_238_part_10
MDPTIFYARYQQYWAELSARLDAPGMSPLRVAERWGAEIEVAGVGTAASAGDNAGPRLALALLSAVVERGGCFAVSAHKRWDEVCQAVGLVREGRGHDDDADADDDADGSAATPGPSVRVHGPICLCLGVVIRDRKRRAALIAPLGGWAGCAGVLRARPAGVRAAPLPTGPSGSGSGGGGTHEQGGGSGRRRRWCGTSPAAQRHRPVRDRGGHQLRAAGQRAHGGGAALPALPRRAAA